MTLEAATLPLATDQKPGSVEAGYGFSLTDAAGFEQALAVGQPTLQPGAVAAPTAEMQVFVQPLSALDKERADLLQSVSALDQNMSFQDMYLMVARFGMHSANVTLLSSIASKSSEGLQQLFRQQS